MAFTYTVSDISPGGSGSKAFAFGTYTSTLGDTGGDIVTGLETVLKVMLQPSGAAVKATRAAVDATLPVVNKGAVTVVTSANEVGQWLAVGY